ncbi:MAG TPA: DinB family protein [Gemmatimonadales bacterium]|jgi:uncharacterized damage-inducible protein DinB
MKTLLGAMALALCCPMVTGAAQESATPVSDALRALAQRAERNLVEAAEEMPANKYGFKPTAAQMSFGEVLAHLTEGNHFLCSNISGVTAPKQPKVAATDPKKQLVARLRDSFQFCDSALAKVNDSNLSAKVPFFGDREVSRATAMFVTADDWADHYSQLAIYLRLNGLLPPTAKRRSE